jgi:O-antigen/teichoic acid export membrane protein
MYRNSLYAIVSRVVMGVGQALFILGVSRHWGPEGQGLVSLGILVTVSLALVLSCGVELANTFFVGRAPERLPDVFANSLLVSAFSALPAWFAVEIGFHFFGESVFRGFPASSRYVLVALVPLQIARMLLQGAFVGLARFKEQTVAIILQYAILLGGLAALTQWNRPEMEVLYLWMVALAASTLYLIFPLLRLMTGKTRASLSLLKEQLRYGVKGMIGNAANFLNFRLDLYFVAYFLTPAHVGWCAVASTAAESLLYLPKALSQVIFSAAATRGDTTKMRLLFETTTLLTALAMVVGVVAAPWLVPLLLKEAFREAVAPTQIFLVGTFLFGVGFLAANYLYGHGDPLSPTKAAVIAACVTAALDFVVIPRWGIVGAAWCSLTAYAVYAVLNVHKMKRTGELNLGYRAFLPNPAAAFSVAGLVRDYFARARGVSR